VHLLLSLTPSSFLLLIIEVGEQEQENPVRLRATFAGLSGPR